MTDTDLIAGVNKLKITCLCHATYSQNCRAYTSRGLAATLESVILGESAKLNKGVELAQW